MTIIAPSILSANLAELASVIEQINKSGAEWIHIDVMDGHFVPPISFGDNIVKLAKQHSKLFLDVHLMVESPEKHIEAFHGAGSDCITIHYEATKDPLAALQEIKNRGLKAGLAIKPNTDVEAVFDLIPACDLLLIMTVEPGWGGQKFISESLQKIKTAKEFIKQNNLSTLIQVDGGINAETCKQCVEAGVDVLVAGSYIVLSDNISAAVDSLR